MMPCPALLSGAFLLRRWHMFIVSWWNVVTRSKATLETHLCSPPKRHLSTTEMKAIDNRGIPTTVLLVGSWRLTQVGGRHYPPFEGCLLKGDATSLGLVLCPRLQSCFWEVTRWWIPAWLFRNSQVAVAFPLLFKGCRARWLAFMTHGHLRGHLDSRFFSEAKLGCWAAGLSTSSQDRGGRVESAQLKCLREKQVLNESAIHQANIILFKLHCAILSWPATKWNSL